MNLNELSIPELRALKQRVASELLTRSTASLSVGDTVSFQGRQYEPRVRGTVTKINYKSVKVKTVSGAVWKVSPTLLTKEN